MWFKKKLKEIIICYIIWIWRKILRYFNLDVLYGCIFLFINNIKSEIRIENKVIMFYRLVVLFFDICFNNGNVMYSF